MHPRAAQAQLCQACLAMQTLVPNGCPPCPLPACEMRAPVNSLVKSMCMVSCSSVRIVLTIAVHPRLGSSKLADIRLMKHVVWTHENREVLVCHIYIYIHQLASEHLLLTHMQLSSSHNLQTPFAPFTLYHLLHSGIKTHHAMQDCEAAAAHLWPQPGTLWSLHCLECSWQCQSGWPECAAGLLHAPRNPELLWKSP